MTSIADRKMKKYKWATHNNIFYLVNNQREANKINYYFVI